MATQITTRERGRPEEPILSIRTETGEILYGDVVELPRSKVSFFEKLLKRTRMKTSITVQPKKHQMVGTNEH